MERISTFDPLNKVKIKYNGEKLEVLESLTLKTIMEIKGQMRDGWQCPIAAEVNNRIMSLDTNVFEGADIKPIYPWQEEGMRVYQRSLTILLQASAKNLFKNLKLIVGQSLSGGYFYLWQGEPSLSEGAVKLLERKMQQMVKSDIQLRQERWGVSLAREKFKKAGMEDRNMLLRTWWHETIRIVRLGDYFDIYHGPVAPSTSILRYFSLVIFPPGIILKFPLSKKGGNPSRKVDVPKQLFEVYLETYEWNKILGINNIGQLNHLCLTGRINEIIRISESLHEKKIAKIADQIASKKGAKLILIAGPSSSGKTTFSKRLATQLQVIGKKPISLSIDNYYVDREKTPRGPDGNYDFEAIEAVDIELLNENLTKLINGEKVLSPRYSFARGKRLEKSKWEMHRLSDPENGLIIIEGIHGLNKKLTPHINEENKFKIYVSALSQLNLDEANRISTTDVRLIRRIVRDRLYRGYTAEETIKTWPNVKRGEAQRIFPFQGEAEVMFNSTLPYELSVLKVYAENFLLEVPQHSPSFREAYRLIKFLTLLVPVFPDRVPHTSIIREFIGGSHFHY